VKLPGFEKRETWGTRLWQNSSPEYRPATGSAARGDPAGSPKATARAHE